MNMNPMTITVLLALLSWLIVPRVNAGLQANASRRKFRNAVKSVRDNVASHIAGEFSSGIVQHEWKAAPQLQSALAEFGHNIREKRRLKIESVLAEYTTFNFGYMEDIKISETKKAKLLEMLNEIITLAK